MTASPETKSIVPVHRLSEAFRAEELAGLRLATLARLIGLGVISLWNLIAVAAPILYYYESVLILFMLSGAAHYSLRKRWPARIGLSYAFASLDVLLLILTYIVLNGQLVPDWPTPMLLCTLRFVYYFLIVMSVGLSYSPKLTVWTGVLSVLGWSGVLLWVIGQPEAILPYRQLDFNECLQLHLSGEFVDLGTHLEEMIAPCIFTGFLSVVVLRPRRLVIQEVETARQRANLARYFSPNIVDELAGGDAPLGSGRRQIVAALFLTWSGLLGWLRLCSRNT